MILSFKEQFKQPILDGTKIHTIREDGSDRWHAGKHIHAATGVRTENYDCFFQAECVSTQTIFMTYYNEFEVSIDYTYLYRSEINDLAKRDGFEGYYHFAKWFYPLISKSKTRSFVGKIIHWTDFRY